MDQHMTVPETIEEAAALLRSVRYYRPANRGQSEEFREAWTRIAKEMAYQLCEAGIRLDDLPSFLPTTGLTAAIVAKDPRSALELALVRAIQHRWDSAADAQDTPI